MKLARLLTLLLLLSALALPACSRFSGDARRQRAYQKYIRKSTAAHQKQRTKVRRSQQEIPEAAPRTDVTTSTEG